MCIRDRGNDANVAALGEMWLGAGKGEKNIVMVTLGTGVGGGVILEGHPLVGTNGAGGEIGHICVNETETETCGCGKKGCLEQYASATGIARLAALRLAKDAKSSLLRSQEHVEDVYKRQLQKRLYLIRLRQVLQTISRKQHR